MIEIERNPHSFIWPNPPLKEPYRDSDLLKQKMSLIWTDWGRSVLHFAAWYSALCRPPKTCTLKDFLWGAPTLIWSLKKSISSCWPSFLNAATCWLSPVKMFQVKHVLLEPRILPSTKENRMETCHETNAYLWFSPIELKSAISNFSPVKWRFLFQILVLLELHFNQCIDVTLWDSIIVNG